MSLGRLLLELLPITLLSALTPWTIVGVIVLLASRGGREERRRVHAGLVHRRSSLLGAADRRRRDQRDATSTRARSPGSRSVSSSDSALRCSLFARNRWQRRPAPGTAVTEPAWIGKLDRIGPVTSFLFGAFWINGFLVVPAATQIAQADVTGAGEGGRARLLRARGERGHDRRDRLPPGRGRPGVGQPRRGSAAGSRRTAPRRSPSSSARSAPGSWSRRSSRSCSWL